MPEKPDSQTAQTADELPSLKMWRPDIPLPDALLPEGYAVRVLKDDEGVYWCSCFEKDDMGITELSQELFKTKMLDDSNVPAGSIIAVENKDHIPVATCTAQLKDGEPYLHMVATSPQARGKGLGLAACAAALKMHIEQGRKGCWLITQDFINAGKAMGVLIGPGRGSAAGSVVAYCTGITNIDPIRFGLLFDINYLDLSGKGDTPGQLFGDAEMDSRTLFSDIAGFYQVGHDALFSFDLYAGARLIEILSRQSDVGAALNALPDSLNTPELQIALAEGQREEARAFLQRSLAWLSGPPVPFELAGSRRALAAIS